MPKDDLLLPWRYISVDAEGPRSPALFVDRDGVLNERIVGGYVRRRDELVVVDRWFPALRRARSAGMLVVVVSNQGGVAKGVMTRADLLDVTAALIEAAASRGLEIDAVYCCPHHPGPSGGVRCTCRKPAPGLLLRAAADLGIDLGRSALVGDQPSDAEAAMAAGLPAMHVKLVECDTPTSTVDHWLENVLLAAVL